MGQIIKDGDYVMVKVVPSRKEGLITANKAYKVYGVRHTHDNTGMWIDSDDDRKFFILYKQCSHLDKRSWTKCDENGNEIK
jgi:hypothetical protein